MKTIDELKEELHGFDLTELREYMPREHRAFLGAILQHLEAQEKEIQELRKVREIVMDYIEGQHRLEIVKAHLSAQQFNQHQSPQAPGGTYSTHG